MEGDGEKDGAKMEGGKKVGVGQGKAGPRSPRGDCCLKPEPFLAGLGEILKFYTPPEGREKLFKTSIKVRVSR